MKKAWIIFTNSFLRLKTMLVFSVVAGVLLAGVLQLLLMVFGSSASTVRIGMLDLDNSAASHDLALYCTERLNIELVVDTAEALDTELIEKHISAIVRIPAGFERALLARGSTALPGQGIVSPTELRSTSLASQQSTSPTDQESAVPLNIIFMDDYANQVFLKMYLEEYTASLAVLASVAHGDAVSFAQLLADAQESAVELRTEGLSEELFTHQAEMETLTTVIGFIALVASYVSMSLAFYIYDDRKLGVYQRVRASSVSAVQYSLGVCAAGFVNALVLVAGFLCVCLAMGFGQAIPMGVVALLCILFICFMVCASLLCGLILEEKTTIIAVIIGGTTIFSMLGGAWFPLKFVPSYLQQLAHLTPQFWLMDAFYQYADGVTDAWILSAVVLALFSALCILCICIRFAGSRSNTA